MQIKVHGNLIYIVQKKATDVILLDFQKAFVVPHKWLLLKLS